MSIETPSGMTDRRYRQTNSPLKLIPSPPDNGDETLYDKRDSSQPQHPPLVVYPCVRVVPLDHHHPPHSQRGVDQQRQPHEQSLADLDEQNHAAARGGQYGNGDKPFKSSTSRYVF